MNVTFIEDESYFVNLHLKREINESDNMLLISFTLLNLELELVGANRREKGNEDSIEVEECGSDEIPKREKEIVQEDYDKIKQGLEEKVYQIYTRKKKKKSMNLLFQVEPSSNSTLQHTSNNRFPNSSTKNLISYIDDFL